MKLKAFFNYKSVKLLGIYCDCGDWGGTEDIEWRDVEDDDEKYVSGDCGWVENVEWWASEGVRKMFLAFFQQYSECFENQCCLNQTKQRL